MADKPIHPTPVEPGDPIDLTESVAGEEDPGASVDLGVPEEQPVSPAPAPTP